MERYPGLAFLFELFAKKNQNADPLRAFLLLPYVEPNEYKTMKMTTCMPLASAVLGVSLLASCAEFKEFGDTVFEGSIEVPDAVVTHASPLKTRPTVGGKGKTWITINENVGAGNQYQSVRVSGGGYNVAGDVDYDGSTVIYSGMRGILKIGKKTGEFKSFEPSY